VKEDEDEEVAPLCRYFSDDIRSTSM
jgi:hypothetical protein